MGPAKVISSKPETPACQKLGAKVRKQAGIQCYPWVGESAGPRSAAAARGDLGKRVCGDDLAPQAGSSKGCGVVCTWVCGNPHDSPGPSHLLRQQAYYTLGLGDS